jgi:hypothetical protein
MSFQHSKNLHVDVSLFGLSWAFILSFSICDKWKKANDIYFTTSLVGRNQLPFIVNHLTFDLAVFKEKVMSNQIAQGVDISRVEEAFILHKYGMEATSHLDPISYGKLVLAFILFFGFFLFHFLIIFSFLFFFRFHIYHFTS